MSIEGRRCYPDPLHRQKLFDGVGFVWRKQLTPTRKLLKQLNKSVGWLVQLKVFVIIASMRTDSVIPSVLVDFYRWICFVQYVSVSETLISCSVLFSLLIVFR